MTINNHMSQEITASTLETVPGRRRLTKEVKIILAALATVIIVGLLGQVLRHWRREYTTLSAYLLSLPDYSYVTASINDQPFRLELVNTNTSRQQGLSDRSEIGSDGMLFVMPMLGTYPFWMSRMHFDLDIVWLAEDQIVDITPNVPAQPGVPLGQLPFYTNDQPCNLILELPAGRAALLGLQVGDKLVVQRDL